MSDRLAKSLHQQFITAALEEGERGWPANAGWHDFFMADRPETNDPVEMGIVAFCYLAIDTHGEWAKARLALKGILAFLRKETGRLPDSIAARRFKEMLSKRPNKREIEEWFDSVYR